MKNPIRLALLGAAALAVQPTSASAQTYDDSPMAKLVDKVIGGPRWGAVSTFDVAGISLGMTPEQTRAALRKAGLAPSAEDPQQDAFAAVVSQRAADRIGGAVDRSKVPMLTRASGGHGESVEVWYAATREGARVTSVRYMMPASRMEGAAFSRAAYAKYGRPTIMEGSKGLYCTKPERTCATYVNRELPCLTVEPGLPLHEINLFTGQRRLEELKAQTAAAVEAAAPKNAKASF